MKHKAPLTLPMRSALLGLIRDEPPTFSASTRQALERRGLMSSDGRVTDKGKKLGIASMPLDEQCLELGLPLKKVEVETFHAPERQALDLAKNEGWIGTSYEGTTILTLLKAVLFPTLVCMLRRQLPLWNEEEIESLAARGYFEGFASRLTSSEARMLAEGVFCATEETIRLGFDHCKSASLELAIATPDLTPELILSLYKALGANTVCELVRLIQADPYKYRKGWPDLTLIRDGVVAFAEIKTTDRLHESQIETIPYVSSVLGKSRFSVWRLVKAGRS
jgi:hypothetical protein